MNPSPLPVRRFHLVIAPRHDQLPQRTNVVQTAGAVVNRIHDEDFLQARVRLQAHPKFRVDAQLPSLAGVRSKAETAHQHPVIAVFLGGETLHYELTQAFADALMGQVKTACEALDGWYLVTTSRRTSSGVEQLLSERVGHDPRCRLLLLANRDPIDGTMEGMLGSADVVVVTGESISMVSEACASGRRVIVVELPLREGRRLALTKHQRFLRDLVADGYVRLVPVSELGLTLQRAFAARQAPKRLDDFGAIREAVGRLLY